MSEISTESFKINFGKFANRDISTLLTDNYNYFKWLRDSPIANKQIGLKKYLNKYLKDEIVDDGKYRFKIGKYKGDTLEQVYNSDSKYWSYVLNNYSHDEELMSAIDKFVNQ